MTEDLEGKDTICDSVVSLHKIQTLWLINSNILPKQTHAIKVFRVNCRNYYSTPTKASGLQPNLTIPQQTVKALLNSE